MSYIDSPIGICKAEHTIMLTDQTQRECALEHGCPAGRDCPLDGCFARVSGLSEEHARGLSTKTWASRVRVVPQLRRVAL